MFEMKPENINDFDKVIQKTIKELEVKNHCLIFLLNDGVYRYMSIFYMAGYGVKDIKLCTVSQDRYTTAAAIRSYFRKGAKT